MEGEESLRKCVALFILLIYLLYPLILASLPPPPCGEGRKTSSPKNACMGGYANIGNVGCSYFPKETAVWSLLDIWVMTKKQVPPTGILTCIPEK